jgi:hypothetical protein
MSTNQSGEKEGGAYQQDPQRDGESKNEELIMSTNQSGEKEGGGYVTTQACNATKEELLRGGKYEVWDDCPACWKSHGVKCLVADHRSDQSTGNEVMESMMF